MRVKSVIEMEYKELELLAEKHYNATNYSFAAVEECGNDSSHQFEVDGKIDQWDEEDAKLIRSGIINIYRNAVLLNVLCADGHIPPGEYLVTVCW